MNRRRPFIALKRPVFVGCEGMSEVGYVRLLQDLINDAGLPVHLVIEELAPGAGDPLSRVEMAVRKLAHLRRTRTAPEERFVLLDSDQAEMEPGRAERATRLAAQHEIHIVWQRPCFEAVILRHMPGRAANQPPDTQGAQRALVREWAEYRKPMTRNELAARIALEDVIRAAGAEAELHQMLVCFGLIPERDA